MAYKNIKEGADARSSILTGIKRAAKYVAPTLGPVGMTAIIECPGLDPIEADDGVTILKHLEFENRYEQLGLQKIRKAALRTSTEGGDGTASTATLTGALADAAYKALSGDSTRSDEVRSRIKEGLKETLAILSKMKRDVTKEDVVRIATVSSLDSEVAKIISDIISEIGPTGIITVEKGSQLGYTKEVVKGARFDKGLISEYFMNDREKGVCVLDNPYIALVDRKISIGAQIKSIMDAIATTGNKSILFIADDVDGIALASLIQSSKNVTIVQQDGKQATGTYEVACVRNPFTASPSRDFLKDMSALTGATVISEEAGMKLSEAGLSLLGQAEKVIITKDDTTIIGCAETPALKERILKIEADIKASTSEYSTLMLKERLSSLKGGIGVVRVGAYTDTEFASKKLKFDNAIRAAQGALQEGMLPGGGSAILAASFKVSEPIFKEALTAPFFQMCQNAGIKTPQTPDTELGMGYDFKTKKIVNMFEAGIIDSYKVTRLVLESASAIAMDVAGYEVAITHSEEEKNG